jgi:hypothetical protein
MSTFREAVEEILCKDCNKDSLVIKAFDCPKCIVHKQVDRILAAYKAKVEGMPLKKVWTNKKSEELFIDALNEAFEDEFEACKSYLLEEGK